MKNFFRIFALASILVLSSCSGSGPKNVADKAMKCIENKNFKELVDLMIPDSKSSEKEKEFMVALLEEKGSAQWEKNGGLKSYEIGKEEIDEEKGKASVEVKYVYGNGKEESETLHLKKIDDKWYITIR